MADAAGNGKSGKVVIRNIGLLLSGDIDQPIFDADTIVVHDGVIVAVGKEADVNLFLGQKKHRHQLSQMMYLHIFRPYPVL